MAEESQNGWVTRIVLGVAIGTLMLAIGGTVALWQSFASNDRVENVETAQVKQEKKCSERAKEVDAVKSDIRDISTILRILVPDYAKAEAKGK